MAKVDCSEISLVLTDIAMNIGSRKDVNNLDDVVAEMKKTPELADISREQVEIAIIESTTGKKQTQDDLAVKLNAIKRDARISPKAKAAAIDLEKHITEGTLPDKKTKKESPFVSPTLKKARLELIELRKEISQSEPAVVKRLEKSITNLEKRIKLEEFTVKKRKVLSTPKLDELRNKRDSLRKEIRDRNPNSPAIEKAKARVAELEKHLRDGTLPEVKTRPEPSSPELSELSKKTAELRKQINQSEPAIKKRYEKSIAELTRKLEQEDFLPKIKKADIPESQELERLRFERDQLRKKVNQRIRELKPLGFWGRASAPFRFARSLWTAFDVSAVGRQGLFIGLGNPARAAVNLPGMFKALASEQKSQKLNAEIQERPNAPLYAKSKLDFSDLDGDIKSREEVFNSAFAEMIPGVRASSRAFVTYLNLLRADSFDAMVATLGRNGEVTQAEAEAIANYINVATGRGSLGDHNSAMAKSAEALSTVFFAPRLVASRFQLLTAQPFFKGGTVLKKENLRVRGLIAKEYGKFMIGLGTVISLGILAGGDFEEDPRSSDFGKLKFGDTRVDVMGGISQVAVFMARLITRQKKTSRGVVRELAGEDRRFADDDLFDVSVRFIRTKFSPLVGTVVDVRVGENVVGENTDITTIDGAKRVFGRFFVPFSMRDTYEAIVSEGVPKGAALGLVSTFGLGLTTYNSSRLTQEFLSHPGSPRDEIDLFYTERDILGAIPRLKEDEKRGERETISFSDDNRRLAINRANTSIGKILKKFDETESDEVKDSQVKRIKTIIKPFIKDKTK